MELLAWTDSETGFSAFSCIVTMYGVCAGYSGKSCFSLFFGFISENIEIDKYICPFRIFWKRF